MPEKPPPPKTDIEIKIDTQYEINKPSPDPKRGPERGIAPDAPELGQPKREYEHENERPRPLRHSPEERR